MLNAITLKINALFMRLASLGKIPFILVVTAFVMLTNNHSLFAHIVEIYPLNLHHLGFLISLALFFSILTALLFIVMCAGRAARWVLASLVLVSAFSAYYMDQFGVLIDVVMIDNMMLTDTKEVIGLLNMGLFLKVIFCGFIPAWLIVRYYPQTPSAGFKKRLFTVGKLIALLLLIVIPFTANYASFIREHKITRFYANPSFPVYSAIKFFTLKFSNKTTGPLKKIAEDAQFVEPHANNELMIMVVGETARFDRFSLNGYQRETNPRLAKEQVVSFTNVRSCGTSTGVSVPCMFSNLGRKEYEKETALAQQNALDILAEHGIEVLWRDNNSDSKGVATRVKYEDFKSPTLNPMCEGECRDIGMLSGLDDYIKAHKGKDMLIVLHQMGNHGPEYYRRYPKEFEKFKPMCMTGELQDCTQQEVDNSYDNAILYTDYFLSEVIHFLQKYDDQYATAMLYVSDHGESLGEHGFYLHAAPYAIAPEQQTHVPAIVWFGKNFDYKLDEVKPYKDHTLSHDDVFCTLLTAFELKSKTCDANVGWLKHNAEIRTTTSQW